VRACFVLDPFVRERPAAVHAIETVASLLELPWRIAAPGAEPRDDEAVVFAGEPAAAPPDPAAVIAVRDWPEWDLAALRTGRFEGEPLPCPRGALEPPGGERELPQPWLRAVAWLIGREEERSDPRRDQWDCYSGFFTRLGELGILDRPLVNRLATQLERRILAWCERRHVRCESLPRWKNGARFAAALTHDVDDVQLYSLRGAFRLLSRASGPSSYAMRAGAAMALRTLAHGRRRSDPYWNFERWVAEEQRHGFRSTFYVFAPAPRARHENDALYTFGDRLRFEGERITVAELWRRLAGRGFEIGLHGSYLSHLDAAELSSQKRQIEHALGGAIGGTRQHFLRFDVGRTWQAQAEAGFEHDATLGYNEAVGFRAGIAAPFRPWDLERSAPHPLLELPLSLMDGTLFRTLKLDGETAARRVRDHLDAVEEAGGLAVLLWHPNAADEEHFPGWWPSYVAALDHLAARGAWVAPAREIAEWWKERTARQRA
jgi:peptidoglycan/xylan/chitin deacetylase (PgdA/CDA1 family)